MNSLVLIKQVPDTETKIRIKGDKSGIETGDIKWVVNAYDEFAIEEALKIKESRKAGTVTVVTVGPDRAVEALRTAVAMGADKAIHVKSETGDMVVIGRALAAVAKKENSEIIFTGKQALDGDQSAVFGYVAEFLDWPSASVVVQCTVSADAKTVKVEREVEGGSKHVIEMHTPCVVAVNKGINSPRYASLPGIMKAKKKEITTLSLADLGVEDKPMLVESSYELPPERQAGKKLSGDAASQAKELARLLREEAKVL